MNKYSHFIWDWNGTLFNDVSWCIEVMNTMLHKRELAPLTDVQSYHKAFCFPIIDYYNNIGFDFTAESFETLAEEFIDAYHANKSGNSKLHINVEDVLVEIQKSGITQIILSASKVDNLLSQVREFDIEHYFDAILGLSDVFAKSKVNIGLNYFAKNNVEKALVIGDTVHDYEVAMELGADCVLISSGHQNKEALLACGIPVLDDISGILTKLKYMDNIRAKCPLKYPYQKKNKYMDTI